jgi:hypothetical protein
MGLDQRKAIGERQRPGEARAMDFEPALGGYAGGILEYRFDVAVPTG